MTKEQAFSISLPKWPQCIINGESISEEKALEIIRRTDIFFLGYGGNNRLFNEEANRICRIPQIDKCNFDLYDKERKEFEQSWNFLYLNYLRNDWISSSFIGGPHGWCNPDGELAFCNNIGKWPDVEDVYNDLTILGREFPFLNLTCSLMDGEECEEDTKTLVSMQLKEGKVEILNPIPKDKLEENGISGFPDFEDFLNKSENYFSLQQLALWASEVYNKKTH